MKKYSVVLLATLLAGCSHYEWTKPGTTNQEREVAETACNASALRELPPDNVTRSSQSNTQYKKKDSKNYSSSEKADYRTEDANAYSRDTLVKDCMYRKGWTQIEVANF